MTNIKTLAQQLSEVALEKEQLSLKEETIKALLLVEMTNADKIKDSFDFGTVSLRHNPKYIYSEKVLSLDEKIKIQKDKERKMGIAVDIGNDSVVFKPTKKK